MSLAARLAPALVFCLAARAAGAQESPKSPPAISWGVWGGVANNSPTNLWGAEGGRDIGVLAVRAVRRIGTSDRVTFEYVVDLVPAAWVTMPRPDSIYVSPCKMPGFGACSDYESFTRIERARGLGLAPLGFQARFRPQRRVQPYVALSGGILRFREVIPVRGGAMLNFTADAGTGLMFALPRSMGLVTGYKFYHISNGGMARQNPGLDGHMLVVGLRGMAR